jgi:hypothetical protein
MEPEADFVAGSGGLHVSLRGLSLSSRPAGCFIVEAFHLLSALELEQLSLAPQLALLALAGLGVHGLFQRQPTLELAPMKLKLSDLLVRMVAFQCLPGLRSDPWPDQLLRLALLEQQLILLLLAQQQLALYSLLRRLGPYAACRQPHQPKRPATHHGLHEVS